MKCKVVHETGGSLRVKILGRQLSYKEYEALHGLLEKAEGVQRIRTYWATGSIALNFRGDRERLLATIRGISEEDLAAAVEENRRALAELGKKEIEQNTPVDFVDLKKLKKQGKKMSSLWKRRLNRRILIEAAADMILPAPVQVAYHAYQMLVLQSLVLLVRKLPSQNLYAEATTGLMYHLTFHTFLFPSSSRREEAYFI